MRACLPPLVLLLSVASPAFAQTQYYVAATGGSDANSGTSAASPWATCSHAIAAFNPAGGAVINFIASSTAHAGCSNINRGGASTDARLVLRCTASVTAATHCKMAGHFFLTSASNVDIGALPQMGFEYTDPDDDFAVDVVWQGGSGTTSTSGNSIHVIGNYFHDVGQNVSGGCPQAGMVNIPNAHGKTVSDAQVIGNVIDHYGVYPNTTCNVAQGIYILTANGQVYDNIVTRIATAGLQYYDQACNARISNNVFANNRNGMVLYGGNGCAPVGRNTVSNNVIVDNSVAFNDSYAGDQGCSTGNQTLYTNNIVFGNGSTFTSPPAACTTVQDQKSESPSTTFVNYTGTAAGDYHIRAGSLAIGGGSKACVTGGPSPCTPGFDLMNAPRSASTPTIGAYEFGSAVAAGAPGAPVALTATVR